MLYSRFIDIAPRIKKGLRYSDPVVAVESGVIAHGTPFPQNVSDAIKVEKKIRAEGALPALMAIIKGRIRIGLTPDEIELIAGSPDIYKISRQDIPAAVALQKSGALTAGATMVIAQFAGIKVAVSGGIGAVHPVNDTVPDISADLDEFERSDVAVICSGAKISCDMRLTLEYLETKGVPVVGYQTNEFPCFYSRCSGYKLEYSVDSPLEAAHIIKTKWDLGLRGGLLIANPVPEKSEIEWSTMQGYVKKARMEAQAAGISGKNLTPYILDRINDLSGGASARAGSDLLENNALVAARIAGELSRMYK